MQDSLYREEILEHFHDPQNFGELEHCDISARQTNPFCGDDISMFVKFSDSDQALRPRLTRLTQAQDVARMTDKASITSNVANALPGQEKIEDITFTGRGCAISVASASMLTEFAKGKSKRELTKFSEQDMLELLNVQVSETRKKCALLALAVLKDCLG